MGMPESREPSYILWLDELTAEDRGIVGAKNAALGEMMHRLADAGVSVPQGFAITAKAYWDLLNFNDMILRLSAHLNDLSSGKASLEAVGGSIRELFLRASFPDRLSEEISAAYARLCRMCQMESLDVAVRSSATAEDLPEASFAGMLESFLNVSGNEQLLEACRRCYASLFTDRAIHYREKMGFSHTEVALSIGIQQMIRSDRSGAGVMFSIDKRSGFPDLVHISAAWGLGENVVQGTVIPDQYKVFKKVLTDSRCSPIVEKTIGDKEQKRVYRTDGTAGTMNVETAEEERAAFVLEDAEILRLARWALAVENLYGKAMDMEWAKDGTSGPMYIVQARPVTGVSGENRSVKIIRPKERKRPLLTGVSVGEGMAAGKVCVVPHFKAIDEIVEDCILVSPWANTGWVSAMRRKRVRGLVTDFGGTNSHGAIMSRELGIPGILGTLEATEVLRPGQEITISCVEGDNGFVYNGMLKYLEEEIDLTHIPQTRMSVLMNAPSEAAALKWWPLPCDGIGHVRMDVIFHHVIQVHPVAVVHFGELTDETARKEIDRLARGYENVSEYFVDRLAGCMAEIAATRYPAPVIVCMSDLETQEYAALTGGGRFEPDRKNSTYGFRGVARYLSKHYQRGFELECRAVKRAREEMGLSNIGVMLRYCDTPKAADEILALMEKYGLSRNGDRLRIHLSLDLPTNVGHAKALAERFDGFSVAARKLRQLIPSSQQPSSMGSDLHGEVDGSVAGVLEHLIDASHGAGHRLTVRGRTFSRSQNLVRFLVDAGIDAISVNPEAIPRIKEWITEAESTGGSA